MLTKKLIGRSKMALGLSVALATGALVLPAVTPIAHARVIGAIAPKITSPAANARVSSPLTIKGTAGKNRDLTLNIRAIYNGGSQDLGTFTLQSDNNGKWSTHPVTLWLPEGAANAKYQISVQDKKNASLKHSVTVLPPVNIIFKPRFVGKLPVKVAITSHRENATLFSPVTVKGTAAKNSKVKVSLRENRPRSGKLIAINKTLVSAEVTADNSGNWSTGALSFKLPQDYDKIPYQIVASLVNAGSGSGAPTTVNVKLGKRVVALPKRDKPRGRYYTIKTRFFVTDADDGFMDNTVELIGGVTLNTHNVFSFDQVYAKKGQTFQGQELKIFLASSDSPLYHLKGHIQDHDRAMGNDTLWLADRQINLVNIAKSNEEYRIAGDGDSESGDLFIRVIPGEEIK